MCGVVSGSRVRVGEEAVGVDGVPNRGVVGGCIRGVGVTLPYGAAEGCPDLFGGGVPAYSEFFVRISVGHSGGYLVSLNMLRGRLRNADRANACLRRRLT